MQDVKGAKGSKKYYIFYTFSNHEVIRASRKYPIKEIGGMTEKPPPKIIILGTMRGTPKKKTKIKNRKGVK